MNASDHVDLTALMSEFFRHNEDEKSAEQSQTNPENQNAQ